MEAADVSKTPRRLEEEESRLSSPAETVATLLEDRFPPGFSGQSDTELWRPWPCYRHDRRYRMVSCGASSCLVQQCLMTV